MKMVCIAALLQFLNPKITTPAPGPVDIGVPGDYAIGSLTWVENGRVFVGRDERGLYAITAICTHLGCTPHLDGTTFVCPCHGSRFSREGRVLGGPATRALDRAFVSRSADGRLSVDTSRVVGEEYRLQV